MALLTDGQQFPAPGAFDAAAYALDLRQLAEATDAALAPVARWPEYAGWSAGAGEVGTPAIVRSSSVSQGPWLISTARTVVWNSTVFDNTGIAFTPGDLILPDQDQRYWWWIGAYLPFTAMAANARIRTTLYVQDRDPATGQLADTVYRANAYATNVNSDPVTWDGFVRSGGGRLKLSMMTGTGGPNLNAGAYMWAVRVAPDRW